MPYGKNDKIVYGAEDKVVEDKKPWIANPLAIGPQLDQIRSGIRKGGRETAELWEQGKPVQSYMHSLGTLGGAVGGATMAIPSALSPKLSDFAGKAASAMFEQRQTGEAEPGIPFNPYGVGPAIGSPRIGSGRSASTATPNLAEMQQKHPVAIRLAGDVVNTVGMIPAYGVARTAAVRSVKPVQAGLRSVGEAAIKPKLRQLIEPNRVVSKELGSDIKEQTSKAAEIIAKERIYGSMKPENIASAAQAKANQLTNAAFNKAVEATQKGAPLIENAPQTIKGKIIELIDNDPAHLDIPLDKIPAAKKRLEVMAKNWEESVGAGKGLTVDGLISWKRNLGVNWNKGSAIKMPGESIDNALRKAAYKVSDDLIEDKEVHSLLHRASDLYNVSEAVGTKKVSGGLLEGIAKTGLPPYIGSLLDPIVQHGAGKIGLAAGLVAGGQAAIGSGVPGRMMLSLGNIGRAEVPIPKGLSYAEQAKYTLSNLNPNLGTPKMSGKGRIQTVYDKNLMGLLKYTKPEIKTKFVYGKKLKKGDK